MSRCTDDCPPMRPESVACHCSACHRTFTGVTAFDSHRKNGACLDPARMRSLTVIRPGVYGHLPPEQPIAALTVRQGRPETARGTTGMGRAESGLLKIGGMA